MRPFLLFLTVLTAVLPLAGYAQAPLPVPAAPVSEQRAGVAAAVRGSVQIARPGQAGRVASSGAPVFIGDEITTDMKGTVQIILLDQTTFAIGPNSTIVIDEFVYNPANDAGKVTAKVAAGTFRFITGKIAHKKPENMRVNLPAGYVGVRGTMAMGQVNGERSLVVLTGPGAQNNTGNRQGALVIGSEVNGEMKSVDVTKTGFGTVIEGANVPPQEPFEVPENQIQEMSDSLTPEAGVSGQEPAEGSDSASEQSGQEQVDAAENSGETLDFSESSEDLAGETESAAQDASDSDALSEGVTQLEELRTIETGQYHYHNSSVDLFDGNGTVKGSYSIDYDIDFGARTVGGGNSQIATLSNPVGFTGGFTFNLPAQSFSSGAGDASFSYTHLSNAGGFCLTACSADLVSVTLNNNEGDIAANADHVLVVTDSNVSKTYYGVDTLERQSGLS